MTILEKHSRYYHFITKWLLLFGSRSAPCWAISYKTLNAERWIYLHLVPALLSVQCVLILEKVDESCLTHQVPSCSWWWMRTSPASCSRSDRAEKGEAGCSKLFFGKHQLLHVPQAFLWKHATSSMYRAQEEIHLAISTTSHLDILFPKASASKRVLTAFLSTHYGTFPPVIWRRAISLLSFPLTDHAYPMIFN